MLAVKRESENLEMGLFSVVKKIFLWTYARNTWQWDILCVLILGFIFLTPKSWFEGSERRAALTHQNGTAATLLVGPEVVENQEDKVRLRNRVRILSGRPEAEIVGVRKVMGKDGSTIGYQVDIR